MMALHDEHPGYNWRSNKGYGTPEHYEGLRAHGVTVHHRRSFGPSATCCKATIPPSKIRPRCWPANNPQTIHNIWCVDESGDSIHNTLIPQDS